MVRGAPRPGGKPLSPLRTIRWGRGAEWAPWGLPAVSRRHHLTAAPRPARAQVFFSLFKTLEGKTIVVELKNDVSIRGTLYSVDQYLNIKLHDIEVVDKDKHPHLVRSGPAHTASALISPSCAAIGPAHRQNAVKNCFIRGSVVRYVMMDKGDVDTDLLQDATRREAAQKARK